jgi:hypothetical protein
MAKWQTVFSSHKVAELSKNVGKKSSEKIAKEICYFSYPFAG